MPTYADLDRDGKLDLVVPAEVDAATSSWELRAYRGTDGNLLWRHRLSRREPLDRLSCTLPLSTADLNDDGCQDLVRLVIDSQSTPGTWTAIVEAINGTDGKLLWEWTQAVPGGTGDVASSQPYDRTWRQRPRPIIVRGTDGPQVVLNLWSWAAPRLLLVLDRQGQLTGSRTVETARDFRPWPCDLDGDSVDELVLLDGRSVVAVRGGDLAAELWRSPQEAPPFEEVRLYPSAASEPPVILAIGGAVDAAVYDLDPASGKVNARCPHEILLSQVELLSTGDVHTGPAVLFGHDAGELVYCRSLAAPSCEDDDEPMTDRTAATSANDPRLQRPLPWSAGAGRWDADAFLRLAWTLFYACTWIVVPGGFAWWLLRRRTWSLRTWLLLPVVVTVILMGCLVGPPPSIAPYASSWFLASLSALPGLALAGVVVMRLFQRRWRSVLYWLGLCCFVAVVVAGVPLCVESYQTTWEAGERYSLRGWYVPWLVSAKLVGLGLLVGLPTRALFRWLRSGWIAISQRGAA